MNEPRYVRSNGYGSGQIFFASCLRAYDECGMNVRDAKELHTQLGAAIAEAEQTPFDRWWRKQPSCGCPEGYRTICDRKFHQDEAEKLFNAIRSAR